MQGATIDLPNPYTRPTNITEANSLYKEFRKYKRIGLKEIKKAKLDLKKEIKRLETTYRNLRNRTNGRNDKKSKELLVKLERHNNILLAVEQNSLGFESLVKRMEQRFKELIIELRNNPPVSN